MGESARNGGDSAIETLTEPLITIPEATSTPTTKLADPPSAIQDCAVNTQQAVPVTKVLQRIETNTITQTSAQNPKAVPAISKNEELLLQRMMSSHQSWSTLNIENINIEFDASMPSIPAKDKFLNGRQRTAIQVAAVAEDVKLQKTLAKLCEKLSSAFGVIPLQDIQTSVNKEPDNDQDVNTRTAQQYLVVMDTSDKRLVAALPGLGQKVEIFLKLEYDKPNFPAVKIEDSQISTAAQYIYEEMHFRREPSSDSDDADSGVFSLSNSWENTIKKLAQTLSRFNGTESDRPLDPTKATQAALAIVSGVKDEPKVLMERIESWVYSHPWFRFSSGGIQWSDVKWSGKRVKPPPGVRSLKAYFQVVTPWQPRWPRFLRISTVRVNMPIPRQHDTLQKTIDSMILGIGGRLTYEPDLKVQWFEGHVHEKMNSLFEDGPLEAWWEYILDFQTIHPDFHRNLHDVFPGLVDDIEAGKFQGEHATIAQTLTKTKAGKFILGGCPGSGKSTFCQRLASAVVDKGWRPKAGYTESPQCEPRPAQIIYTSPQNEQCKDAIKRFKLLNPDKRACRLYGYNRELQALIRGDDETELNQDSGGQGKGTNKLHKALSQHTKRSAVEHDDPRNPRLDPDSLSSIVRAHATGDALEKLKRGWDLWKNDKQLWFHKEEDLKKIGHQLLEVAVKRANAFFGTLVAVAQCHDHMNKNQGVLGNPALLIVDEVGRLTETHALLGVSLWKEVPTIFTGDHEQFGPIVDTAGTEFNYTVREKTFRFRSVVSAQLEKSFLVRAAAQGGIDARLLSNHRVYGSAGEFPCKLLYDSRMIQAHTEDSPATEAVGEWFARHTQSGKNSLFVDLESEELQQGTSKINPASAYFVVQLAVDIAREMKLPLMEDYKKFNDPLENTGAIRKGRILILVAYAPQKVQVLSCLKRISAHEVDKSRISVRTIDDSPSHEAEIAIIDLVRTDGIGFLAEPARLKVAATRAQLGTIWVSHRVLCQRNDNILRKLYDYHRGCKAVKHVRGYDLVCDTCCRAGHSHGCSEKNLRCNVCDKDSRECRQHAARNCRRTTWPTRAEWDAERWMSSPKSVDSVVRDPFVTK